MEFVSFVPTVSDIALKKYRTPAEKEAVRHLTAEYKTVLRLLRQTFAELQSEYQSFDYLTDEKSIDACIYRILASQSRYDSLLRQQKRLCKKLSAIQKPYTDIQV